MEDYYTERLSAGRLKRVYEVASERVRQYLEAELDHVLSRIGPGDAVLDLGCGYGRILEDLSRKAEFVVGIDLSLESLKFGWRTLRDPPAIHLVAMNAVRLAFKDSSFDVVVCIQNGISAFHVDQRSLIEEAVRVLKPGGIALFSSYSEKFFEPRLEWFRRQAESGLLGEIDEGKTKDGVIVCKDGFTATTVSPADFRRLTEGLRLDVNVVEVDGSSAFCEMRKGA